MTHVTRIKSSVMFTSLPRHTDGLDPIFWALTSHHRNCGQSLLQLLPSQYHMLCRLLPQKIWTQGHHDQCKTMVSEESPIALGNLCCDTLTQVFVLVWRLCVDTTEVFQGVTNRYAPWNDVNPLRSSAVSNSTTMCQTTRYPFSTPIRTCSIVWSVKLPPQNLSVLLIVKCPSSAKDLNCSIPMTLGKFQNVHMPDEQKHAVLESSRWLQTDEDPSSQCALLIWKEDVCAHAWYIPSKACLYDFFLTRPALSHQWFAWFVPLGPHSAQCQHHVGTSRAYHAEWGDVLSWYLSNNWECLTHVSLMQLLWAGVHGVPEHMHALLSYVAYWGHIQSPIILTNFPHSWLHQWHRCRTLWDGTPLVLPQPCPDQVRIELYQLLLYTKASRRWQGHQQASVCHTNSEHWKVLSKWCLVGWDPC